MTNEISGENKSLTESRKDDFIEKLDEVLKNLIVPEPKVSNNIEDILSLTYQQLKEISIQECNIFAYQLKQYSYYVQMKENRFKNIERWSKESMRGIFGKYAQEYGTQYSKYEERCDMVIADNSYALALNKIIILAGGQAKELEGLSYRLLDMSKSLADIALSKRKNNED